MVVGTLQNLTIGGENTIRVQDRLFRTTVGFQPVDTTGTLWVQEGVRHALLGFCGESPTAIVARASSSTRKNRAPDVVAFRQRLVLWVGAVLGRSVARF